MKLDSAEVIIDPAKKGNLFPINTGNAVAKDYITQTQGDASYYFPKLTSLRRPLCLIILFT